MEQIHKPGNSFDFSKILLFTPKLMNGGNYLIKIKMDDNPLYIEVPISTTKNGIVKSGKKYICDILLSNDNNVFIKWITDLENACKNQLFENKNKWFENNLEEEDIVNSFTPCLKSYKTNERYLLRTNIPTSINGNCNLKVYDKTQIEIDIEKINEHTRIISVLEILGVNCSMRNFQIEMEVKQMMVLDDDDIFKTCVFKLPQQDCTDKKHEENFPTNSLCRSPENPLLSTLRSDEKMNKNTKQSLGNNGKTLAQKTNDLPEIKEICGANSLTLEKTAGSLSLEQIKDPSQAKRSEGNTCDNVENISGDTIPGALQNNNPPSLRSGVPPNSSESSVKKLRASPERSEGEDHFSVACEGKLRNSPERSVDKLGNDIMEVNIHLDKNNENESIHLKQRNLIYYEMYKEARRRAKIARDLAISSYLEAKHIKNTYMLSDMKDSDSDNDDIDEKE
jgi:hypothetical protein